MTTSFRAAALSIALLSTLATTPQAAAREACVSTAAELQQALTDASDGGPYVAEDNLVKLVAGTYRTGAATSNGPFFFYSSHSTTSLTLYGGYGAGCSGNRHAAADTILDGHGSTGVLILRSKQGPVTVTHMTLQNGDSDAPGAGLQINYLVTVENSVQVDHVIIRGNHSSVDAGGLYASGASSTGSAVTLSDALIVDNASDANYGGAYVTPYGDTALVDHATIARNSAAATSDRVGGLYCGGTALCNVFDTIAWNNSNIGLYFESPAALVCDDYGAIGGAVPDYVANVHSVSPAFVDAANGDYHLGAGSPLFGLCAPGNGTTDLDDRAFPGHGGADVGAYEDTVFVDGNDG